MQAACKQSLNFCLYSALHSRAQRECETVSSKPNRPEDLARRVAARRSAETAGRHAATGQWRRETFTLPREARLSSIDITHGDAVYVQEEQFFVRNSTNVQAVVILASLVTSTLGLIFTVVR